MLTRMLQFAMHRLLALFLGLMFAVVSSGALVAQEVDGTAPVVATFYTIPPVALNLVPGFGLGSYLQGESGTGLWLTGADVLGFGLAGLGLWGLNQFPGEDEGGEYALSLLAGYGFLAASRVAGIIAPILVTVREGADRTSLLVPVFYNMLPGFGLGSLLQGDHWGANWLAALDAVAFGAVGALSFAALGGFETATAVFGITAMTAYATGRVFGVVRPVVFARSDP